MVAGIMAQWRSWGGVVVKVGPRAGVPSGTPDLVGVLFGRCVVVEVKRPGGVVSDVQRVRLDEWKAGGARVLVCDSVEGFCAYFDLLRFGYNT